MLPPTSIFRRMPGALILSQRRLLGAIAYAYDSADLSFERLKGTARRYTFPEAGKSVEAAGWTPARRVALVVDAWACIDHINRARKLVSRIPIRDGGAGPAELSIFLKATKAAASIRNRLQHIDEDIFSGANCTEGHPVLGAVMWADARGTGGHVRYAVNSGPAIDRGKWGAGGALADVDGAGDVLDFQLMAADQHVSLDDLMRSFHVFMAAFELTTTQEVLNGIRAAAKAQGVDLRDPRPHGIADMTSAYRFRRKPDKGWELANGDIVMHVEVPVGTFDISEQSNGE